MLLQFHQTFGVQNLVFFFILLLVLLVLSAMMSGAEVSFFNLGSQDLNLLKTRQKRNARLVLALLQNPRLLQTTLRVANLMTKICIILVSDYLLDLLVPLGGNLALSYLVKILTITILVVLFAEILPRVYAGQNSLRMALSSARTIHLFQSLFIPLSKIFLHSAERMERQLGVRESAGVSFEEIDQAIESSSDVSATEEEKNILKGVVKFSHITVRQIMRSRLEVSGIEYQTPFPVLIRLVGELHYSRLPVYTGDLDHIKGLIHTKDLLPHLEKPEDFDWHEVMRSPYFIPEHKPIEDLMKDFQIRHSHFAIVVDEFGGTSGIVTLEDIVEEVIGDIRDEFDEEVSSYTRLDDHTYLFEGKSLLNDVCRVLGIPADTFEGVRGQSESLGGLILEVAGAFPELNRVISFGRFEFTVTETNKLRILKVKIRVQPEHKDETS